LAIPFSNDPEFIKTRKIVLCTLVSLAKPPQTVTFDRVIVDEASINKIDHLLMPFQLSLKRQSYYSIPISDKIAGESARAKPPIPAVSVMALSSISRFASSGP
jgi:hypothetical protein